MIDLKGMIKAINDLAGQSTESKVTKTSRGLVTVTMSQEVYDRAIATVQNLQIADLVEHKTAVAAYPLLVRAAQLILSLDALPSQNPDVVRLAPKTRKQLQAAVKRAGLEPAGRAEDNVFRIV